MKENLCVLTKWDMEYNDINKLKSNEIPEEEYQLFFKKDIKKYSNLELLIGLRITYLQDTGEYKRYSVYSHWKHIIILNLLLSKLDK